MVFDNRYYDILIIMNIKKTCYRIRKKYYDITKNDTWVQMYR